MDGEAGDVVTTDFDFARRSGRNRISIVSHKLNFYARQRYTDAARNTLAPQRVRQCHTDLRHAVTLKQSVADAKKRKAPTEEPAAKPRARRAAAKK